MKFKKPMKIIPIKTHIIQPNEPIIRAIGPYLDNLEERDVVLITSKIVSISEGRLIKKKSVGSKELLIKKEADAYIEDCGNYDICLTLKNNILIPSAGIDESNSQGHYVLYPQDVQRSTERIWKELRQLNKIESLGIIITDSHTTPLRRGVTGIGLGWCGFKALKNYIGSTDLDGKKLCFTQSNLMDGLSAAAVLVMGEGDEQTPIVIIRDFKKLEFQNHPPTPEEKNNLSIEPEKDLYAPLLRGVSWKRSNQS